jgi:excinuclease UvrABC nuclease subunit
MAVYINHSSYLPWTAGHVNATPEKPGVYILRPSDQTIGYIGSAGTRGLRARLAEHYNQDNYPRTAYFDWYQTATEADARELELDWIARYSPPWNKT